MASLLLNNSSFPDFRHRRNMTRPADKIVVKRPPCLKPVSTTPHTSQLLEWGRAKANAGNYFEIPAPQARGEYWGSQAVALPE